MNRRHGFNIPLSGGLAIAVLMRLEAEAEAAGIPVKRLDVPDGSKLMLGGHEVAFTNAETGELHLRYDVEWMKSPVRKKVRLR